MSHRSRVLALYRAFLRQAKLMPTENRQAFVLKRAQSDFRAAMHEHDPEQVEFHVSLGETQLENGEGADQSQQQQWGSSAEPG